MSNRKEKKGPVKCKERERQMRAREKWKKNGGRER